MWSWWYRVENFDQIAKASRKFRGAAAGAGEPGRCHRQLQAAAPEPRARAPWGRSEMRQKGRAHVKRQSCNGGKEGVTRGSGKSRSRLTRWVCATYFPHCPTPSLGTGPWTQELALSGPSWHHWATSPGLAFIYLFGQKLAKLLGMGWNLLSSCHSLPSNSDYRRGPPCLYGQVLFIEMCHACVEAAPFLVTQYQLRSFHHQLML